MLGNRITWRQLRVERENDPEYRAAYFHPRQAYEIGRKVRRLREARGITQAELAARMGSSQSVIARLELGGAELRFETLTRVAEALDSALIVDLRPREGTAGAGGTRNESHPCDRE